MKLSLRVTTLHLSPTRALLLVLALGFVGYSGYDYVQQSRAVDNAVAVNATITETEIIREAGGRDQIEWVPAVEYTYQYRGQTYTSENVFPGVSDLQRGYYDRSKAEAITNSYEPGTTAQAYVLPTTPSTAFLIKQQGTGPLWGVGIGIAGAVIIVLASLGDQQVGRAEPQAASTTATAEPAQNTWLQQHSDAVHRWSKRLFVGALAVFVVSLATFVLSAIRATQGRTAPQPDIQASLTGPVGLPLVIAGACYIGLIVATCLYGVWSFSQYRRLRRRIATPRPPSPFRHPSRLLTILVTRHAELSEYGKRIRLTGFILFIAAFLTGILTWVLLTAQ